LGRGEPCIIIEMVIALGNGLREMRVGGAIGGRGQVVGGANVRVDH